MKQQRSVEEEQLRQLKLIQAQQNPLGAFIRLGFWLTVFLFAIGILARLCVPGSLFL